MNRGTKIALVVLSCDSYSDLWEPYGMLFNQFWADCPFDKYFASNNKTPNIEGFKALMLGEDISWSHGLKVAIKKLKEEYSYIIMPFDDMMLVDNVNTEYVMKAINSFLDIDGNYLRLQFPVRPPMRKFNEYFGEIKNNIPYRQTMGFAVWKIDILDAILNNNESAWEFEKQGVRRGFAYDNFFCMYQNQFKCINLVIKRQLVSTAYSKLKKILPEVNIDRPFLDARVWIINNQIKGFMLRCFIKFFPAKLQGKIYFIINKKSKLK